MRVLLSLILSCVLCASAYAKGRATIILRQGEEVMRGRTMQSILSMSIVRESFTRNLLLRAWTSGPNRSLVEILDPPKEEGVASLRVRQQMWNYLPKAEHVVRVRRN